MIAAPLMEEILFRGFLYRGLSNRGSAWSAPSS